MDDLYFEKELINKEKEKYKDTLNNLCFYLPSGDRISTTTMDVYQNFDDILYEYYMDRFGDKKEYNEIEEMIESFKRELTNDRLLETYDNYEFSQDEIEYIKLVEVSNTWREKHNYDIRAGHAIIDILLRSKIIERFGENELEVLREIMQTKFLKCNKYKDTITHYMQLFSDNPYGENIYEKLEKNIEEKSIYSANQKINCGGYALKIDVCVYPTYQEGFSKSVSSILDRFPFVRLLGDKPLEDDEYLVIYRANQGKNTAHHFIRVDSDATVREKDGNGEPRNFENWGDLEKCPEAVFAVKKEHKMFGYESNSINYDYEEGLDFEESINKYIRERHNLFSYHNHNFSLKKSKEDEIFVIDEKGQIVADVVADESECLIEIRENKREYIENTSGFIKPIIRNGKLINFEQFKEENTQADNFYGR